MLLLTCNLARSQTLFHQDIFYGGVTAGGVSTGIGAMFPGDTVSMPLYIEPGSSIRKAYLFTYEVGYPPFSQTIFINGSGFTFDSTCNKIMTVNHANFVFTPIRLYYKDITNYLNSNLTDTFDIYFPYTQIPNPPPPNSLGWGWYTAFIYIEYDNSSLQKVASSIWINDKDFDYIQSTVPYQMSGMNQIDNNFPVGLSLFTDRIDDNNRINVFFNNNFLGKISYPDSINNQWYGSGVKGHFYYQNNTLYGLDDDTANTTMNNSDGLVDISSLLSNGASSYSVKLEQEFLPPHPLATGSRKSVNLLFLNAYTTHCDTFSTSIIADTVICKGDSVQLFASGGTNYYWLPQTGLSNANIANPMASPDSTTLYVVRIENTPGCSRTEKVLVKVNKPPKINSIGVEESVCGNDDGKIIITASGNLPLQYSMGNGFQSSNTFANLTTGNYTITVLDNKGCSTDTTFFVPEIN
ncbi:MAG: hypothetical protein QW303_08620 [Nitrososphaerota archaeon]